MKRATFYGIGTKSNSLKSRLEEIQRNQEIFKIESIGDAREELASHERETKSVMKRKNHMKTMRLL